MTLSTIVLKAHHSLGEMHQFLGLWELFSGRENETPLTTTKVAYDPSALEAIFPHLPIFPYHPLSTHPHLISDGSQSAYDHAKLFLSTSKMKKDDNEWTPIVNEKDAREVEKRLLAFFENSKLRSFIRSYRLTPIPTHLLGPGTIEDLDLTNGNFFHYSYSESKEDNFPYRISAYENCQEVGYLTFRLSPGSLVIGKSRSHSFGPDGRDKAFLSLSSLASQINPLLLYVPTSLVGEKYVGRKNTVKLVVNR